MRTKALFIFLIIYNCCFSGIDSLRKVLSSKQPDSLRIVTLFTISYQYELQRNLLACDTFQKEALFLAKKIKSYGSIGEYYNFQGRKCYYRQAYDSAIIHFNEALNYFEKAKYNQGISTARNNIAAIYSEQGEIKRSITEHRKLAEFNKKIKDDVSLASSYSNLGFCFMEMTLNDSAIYYLIKAMKIHERLKMSFEIAADYQNLSTANFNIKEYAKAKDYIDRIFSERLPIRPYLINLIYSLKANIFSETNQPDSAVIYIKKAIEACKSSNDRLSMVTALVNESVICSKKGDFKAAKNSALEAIKISKDIESESALNRAYFAMAEVLNIEKNFKEAIVYYEMAYAIDLKNNSSIGITNNLKQLAKCHQALGNHKEAADLLDSCLRFKDRLNEESKFKSLKDIEAKYETEKKDLQLQKSDSDLKVSISEGKRKSIILIMGSAAFIVTLFFAIIALVNFRKAKKANTLVQSQNKTLEQKNHEVELQKNLVLEKQEEIISSINYAKKIQSAVLTGEEVWKRISKEYFILFKPKDIVSGDFYWAHVLPNGRAIFALADCTGHGVPGGFMSMLGNSFLNELVVENKIFNAAAILNKLREKIIKALDQKGNSEQKDGMDIVLCVWNKMDNTLEFAGANNNLYFVREHKMNELKGNKMPIGTYVTDNTQFTSQTIQLQKGDCIYLTTDGFADQFGGPHGKKYKYKQMEDVLLTIHDIPMDQQAEILEKELNDWKNVLEQVDDVCVLGIRV